VHWFAFSSRLRANPSALPPPPRAATQTSQCFSGWIATGPIEHSASLPPGDDGMVVAAIIIGQRRARTSPPSGANRRSSASRLPISFCGIDASIRPSRFLRPLALRHHACRGHPAQTAHCQPRKERALVHLHSMPRRVNFRSPRTDIIFERRISAVNLPAPVRLSLALPMVRAASAEAVSPPQFPRSPHQSPHTTPTRPPTPLERGNLLICFVETSLPVSKPSALHPLRPPPNHSIRRPWLPTISTDPLNISCKISAHLRPASQ